MNMSSTDHKRIEEFKTRSKSDPKGALKSLEAEIALQRKGSASAVAYIRDKKFDTVTASMIVNAWAAAFFAGYRFYEKHGAADTRRWWQRLSFWDRHAWAPFTVVEHARAMSRQYVNQNFHSLSPQMIALVTSSAEGGFKKGYGTAVDELGNCTA